VLFQFPLDTRLRRERGVARLPKKMDDFDDEGNAAELEFGKEFAQDVQFLMNDEVYILLHLLGNDSKIRAGIANEYCKR
jgi:hypothetical protein